MSIARSAAGSWLVQRWCLPALALLVSCYDRSATEPASGTAASTSRAIVAASIFTVEPTIISVPTYDGSGQSVHPDVVAFDQRWHGARYWFTMTPYPRSDQHLENPSILRSDDGTSVSVPPGLVNPVAKAPRNRRNYNSDPELLYEPVSDRLVLFYRLVEKRANTIRMATSQDGVTWIPMAEPFWERAHNLVSPTVAPRPNAAARMWYVNAGKAGCDAQSTRVVMRTASDGSGGIVATRWEGPHRTDLSIPGYNIWHIKARWIPARSEYWMLISAYPVNGNGCQTDDLFFARSVDGLHWTTYTQPILRHGDRDWTAAAVYRSSFLYDASTDQMSLWISARGVDNAWRLGYARVRYANLLSALENNVEVGTPSRVGFKAPAAVRVEEP